MNVRALEERLERDFKNHIWDPRVTLFFCGWRWGELRLPLRETKSKGIFSWGWMHWGREARTVLSRKSVPRS
jgi:hypothetical protein